MDRYCDTRYGLLPVAAQLPHARTSRTAYAPSSRVLNGCAPGPQCTAPYSLNTLHAHILRPPPTRTLLILLVLPLDYTPCAAYAPRAAPRYRGPFCYWNRCWRGGARCSQYLSSGVNALHSRLPRSARKISSVFSRSGTSLFGDRSFSNQDCIHRAHWVLLPDTACGWFAYGAAQVQSR